MPGWTSRSLSPLPEPWPDGGNWIAEWMTIDDETWYARISPTGDPDMPPIVMVHGLVVSGAYFRPVAAEMGDRYRILVPDLPGYGRSRSRRIWTVPSITTRLAQWMDLHDLQGAILVANSLGCQISTLLAVDRPDLVRGMVLVAPTLDPEVRSSLHLMLRGAIDIPREKQRLWRIWLPDFFRAGIRRSLAMLHQTMLDGPEQLARLPNVRQPTLVVGGGVDPIVPAAWVKDMTRRMPNARHIILPGCSHAMNYSDPRNLARAIDTVIAGQTWERHADPDR
ncbi:MAG TPA: alpha/beta hydrolase [Thermomicrobiales bacterium]|nr:alpha/beta hydrolase [Thermomicrobiales bacterium]